MTPSTTAAWVGGASLVLWAIFSGVLKKPDAKSAYAGAMPASSSPIVGDAAFQKLLTLNTWEKVDGQFRARLKDGRRLVLTLDAKVQEAAELALARGQAPAGAIVVMDTQGRILALAGREGGKNGRVAPNLCTSVWAPAASVFKIITAAALLSDGVSPSESVCYHGGLRRIDESNLEDSPRDNDCQNLRFAMGRSTNSIFAKLSYLHLDADDLESMAKTFGIGSELHCALPSESGRVSLPRTPLDFARAAAGFQGVHISPLEGALLTAVVANQGRAVTPRIVDKVLHPDGQVQEVLSEPSRVVLDETIAKTIGDLMLDTVTSGTAREGFRDTRNRPYFDGVAIAGKTGSLTQADPYRAFSWFVGYAPADKPRVIVSVVLGNGEKWHIKAHTAARMVLETVL
jgi:cell division protein FtsI/penicillin-binding protein 2